MKTDRIAVFLLAAACWLVPNVAATDFPRLTEYGRGFPLKWSYDPMYREAQARDVPPYLRKLSPSREWEFDGAALAVDITLGLVVVGLALALNEAAQVALGNRPPADCHPYGPPPRPPRGPWPPPRPGPRRPH